MASAAPPKRTQRACDECRRLKIRCEPQRQDGQDLTDDRRCRGCQSSGIECTYTAPIHKRGPPKGYLSALERRLNDAEALLGALLCSRDPRAVTLMSDLCKDHLASSILHRIASTEFGPQGRAERAKLCSTKPDVPAFYVGSQGHLVFSSPNNTWQDYLDMRINLQRKARLNSAELPSVQCPDPHRGDLLSQDVSGTLLPNSFAIPTSLATSPPPLFSFDPGSKTASPKSMPSSTESSSSIVVEEISPWLTGDGNMLQTPLGL